jgi:hypothetical protein
MERRNLRGLPKASGADRYLTRIRQMSFGATRTTGMSPIMPPIYTTDRLCRPINTTDTITNHHAWTFPQSPRRLHVLDWTVYEGRMHGQAQLMPHAPGQRPPV